MAQQRTKKTRKRKSAETVELNEEVLFHFYAGCALMGIVARIGIPDFSVDQEEQVAAAAHDYAVAMLKAVSEPEEDEEEPDDP